MCMGCALSCTSFCFLSSDSRLGKNCPSDSHAQSEGHISSHMILSPHCDIPIPVATTSRLPSEGGIMSMDQPFESALHPSYTKQPPHCMTDYRVHHLGLSPDTTSLETPSYLPTLLSSFPAANVIDVNVSHTLVTLRYPLQFRACAFVGGGLLIGFHRLPSAPRIPILLHWKTLWALLVDPKDPLSISLLSLIGPTTSDDNLKVWYATNPELSASNSHRSAECMTGPEGSQQRGMSLIHSNCKPHASCTAVPNSPANGSPRSSRTVSLSKHSFVVSRSRRSRI